MQTLCPPHLRTNSGMRSPCRAESILSSKNMLSPSLRNSRTRRRLWKKPFRCWNERFERRSERSRVCAGWSFTMGVRTILTRQLTLHELLWSHWMMGTEWSLFGSWTQLLVMLCPRARQQTRLLVLWRDVTQGRSPSPFGVIEHLALIYPTTLAHLQGP